MVEKRAMNTASITDKLNRLHELDALLAREIRGQSQVLPRIVSTVKRGELNLTNPDARAEVFCCWDRRAWEKPKRSWC